MPAKDIIYSEDARAKILEGVGKLTKAVACTMGQGGRNVLFERKYSPPILTKDGVTAAKEVELKDHHENMGAELVKEAATKTNELAGDGTTTATVLAHAMMVEGKKYLDEGRNAINIKNGIEKAVEIVKKFLTKTKRDIDKREEYKAVATISSQNEEIGEIVAEVIEHVGKDGVITLEAGHGMGIEKEYVEGMQFDGGYVSPYFAQDQERMEAMYEDTFILMTDRKIVAIDDILPILEQLKESKGNQNLVIIADGVDGDALATLAVNQSRGAINCFAVKSPSFGTRRKEIMQDIAILTGATVLTDQSGITLENVTLNHCGKAGKVIATAHNTIIVSGGGKKENVEKRCNDIRFQIDKKDNEMEKEALRERLARILGGVAVIKVGAATEVAQKEKQYRVEDALNATRSAADEGIVAGGGIAYIRAMQELNTMKDDEEDVMIGMSIVAKALAYPMKHIVENVGEDFEEVLEKVLAKDGDFGMNTSNHEIEDLVKSMIVDPKKVTRLALENAASVASMFLTLECVIAYDPEEMKEKGAAMPQPPRMR